MLINDHPKISCLIPYGVRYLLKGFRQIFHFFWLPRYDMVRHYKVQREAVKNYLADFFPLRGGGTPFSAKGFQAE